MSHSATQHDADHAHGPHAVSPSILLAVFAALLVLTAATVGARFVDFGTVGNLVVAIVIAIIKAVLVALYFMHLRWDSKLNGLIVVASFIFVTLFIVFAVVDTRSFAPDLEQPYAPGIDMTMTVEGARNAAPVIQRAAPAPAAPAPAGQGAPANGAPAPVPTH